MSPQYGRAVAVSDLESLELRASTSTTPRSGSVCCMRTPIPGRSTTGLPLWSCPAPHGQLADVWDVARHYN
ncbi:MAG TPA: hypothetical protein VGC11_16825 [Acidimicrobiia bacterium]